MIDSSASRYIVVSYNTFCPRRRGTVARCVEGGGLGPIRLLIARNRLSRGFNGRAVCRRFKLGPRITRNSRGLVGNLTRRTRAFCRVRLSARFPPVNRFFRRSRMVGFNGRRFAVVRAPNRDGNSMYFCYRTRRMLFSNSALFGDSVNEASFPNNDVFHVVGDLHRLNVLPSRARILPNRKRTADVNRRLTRGPCVSQ